MDLVHDVHSWVRWVILAAGGVGLVHSLLNLGPKGPSPPHRALAGAFLGLLDLQLLLGVVIFIGDSESRGAGLPHGLVMLSALVMAHLLRVQARKAAPAARGRMAAAYFGVPLAIALVGIAVLS